MSFEAPSIDRTGCSYPLKGSSDRLPSKCDVPQADHTATCFAFPQHLCAAESAATTLAFDHARFGATKSAKSNGGADRLEEGKGQDAHIGSVDHACAGHAVGAFHIISPNQTIPARHLHTCGDPSELEQTHTAFDGRMTLFGSKTYFGRRH